MERGEIGCWCDVGAMLVVMKKQGHKKVAATATAPVVLVVVMKRCVMCTLYVDAVRRGGADRRID